MFSCTEGVYEGAETEALKRKSVSLLSKNIRSQPSVFAYSFTQQKQRMSLTQLKIKSLICLDHDMLRHLL